MSLDDHSPPRRSAVTRCLHVLNATPAQQNLHRRHGSVSSMKILSKWVGRIPAQLGAARPGQFDAPRLLAYTSMATMNLATAAITQAVTNM